MLNVNALYVTSLPQVKLGLVLRLGVLCHVRTCRKWGVLPLYKICYQGSYLTG